MAVFLVSVFVSYLFFSPCFLLFPFIMFNTSHVLINFDNCLSLKEGVSLGLAFYKSFMVREARKIFQASGNLPGLTKGGVNELLFFFFFFLYIALLSYSFHAIE